MGDETSVFSFASDFHHSYDFTLARNAKVFDFQKSQKWTKWQGGLDTVLMEGSEEMLWMV